MIRKMHHPIYGKNTFFFSPMFEMTTRFDDLHRIPERVSYYQLFVEGWRE